MNKKRPINLDLGTLKYPPMAIASILHRLSGILLFLLLPFFVYFLDLSIKSPQSFNMLQIMLTHSYWKLMVWLFSSALIYHLLAGIRHLLMDIGIGEHLSTGRQSAVFVIGGSVVLILLIGIWLW